MKMSRNKYLIAVLITGFGLSACRKDFDAKSYAPVLNVNGYTSSAQIATSSLVAHWGFNGNLTDTISKIEGVSTNTSFTTGLLGQALQGSNNGYVISAVPSAIQNIHSFTLSVWYNMPENTNGVVALVDIANSQNFWGNLDIFLENPPNSTTGQLKVHLWDKGTSTTGTDAWEGDYTANNAFNVWDQVAVSYNDTTSTVKVYYNGSLLGTNTQAGFAPLNWVGVDKMVFGTLQFQTNPSLTSAVQYPGFGSFLVGALDEVRVYNRVLTSTEISSLAALQLREK
jgi:Concanavalin A-like lectin/glucanases superfamily